MSATLDIDATFKHALKLLHSANSESAEKIRNLLDELIKQRYGNGKTLINTLNKKHLAEEPLAVGSNLYVRKQKVIEPKPVAIIDLDPDPETVVSGTIECLTIPQSGPIVISTSDLEGDDDDVVMEEDKLKELEDLMCVVCRLMDVSARNRLVECADCHSLFHQECHKPNISETDANDEENAWYCTLCRSKQAVNKSHTMVHATSIPIATSPSPLAGNSSSVLKSSSHSKSSSTTSNVSKPFESSSSSSSKHKSSSSKSNNSKSLDSSHERDKDRDRDRERDRERDRDKSSKSSLNVLSSSNSSASSSSSSAIGTPSINIISADKRIQMMKKKAAKMHDNKRKHK
ncbi:integrator complex subunit 12-like [Anopheles bellator]|uniref:integrator complex subunit 12-like n=1 Tax=Anopheles bellator TaxID=139047 RepID=UPI00264847EC|nr:integrator complex subunit 12-like [Anopheles bellator]